MFKVDIWSNIIVSEMDFKSVCEWVGLLDEDMEFSSTEGRASMSEAFRSFPTQTARYQLVQDSRRAASHRIGC